MMITPTWQAPTQIKAFTTLRSGGVSQPPFEHLNLAMHVGDSIEHVTQNRIQLQQQWALPSEPIWLKQIHSTIALPAKPDNRNRQADATYSNEPNQVCVVLTADCLPILLCNRQGTYVAAIHAGWRGLANNIIEKTLAISYTQPHDLMAWLGPAIGPKSYEVGDAVREAFIQQNAGMTHAFTPSRPHHWLCDLYAIARIQLQQLKVTAITGGEYCTFSDTERFYSYRRDGEKTGRMASLIWISEP